MTTTGNHFEFEFEAPGKGSWSMDAVHCPKPLTGLLEEIFAPALSGGMRDCCERYGMLLETLHVRYVHGFPYIQPKPVGAPAGATGTPPKLLFKLATWLHPAIRSRLARCEQVLAEKLWRQDLERWDGHVKARTIAAHRRFEEVEVRDLDDAGLAEHLLGLRDHAQATATQDHGFNLACMLPAGDLVAHGMRWTRRSGADLLALLQGHSDSSRGELAERRRLLQALDRDPAAKAIFEGEGEGNGDPADIVEALRTHVGEVGEAMRDYLLIVGNSPALGLGLPYPAVREQPATLLAALRQGRHTPPRANGIAVLEAAVRAEVPEAHRATFDELLAEARHMARLRDERHLYGAIPLLGLGRRTLLEAGRRLTRQGKLSHPELACFVYTDELASLLSGRPGPSSAEVEARRDKWEALDASHAPPTLGPTSQPPPSDWLPPAARRMAEALDAYFALSDHQPTRSDGARLTGAARPKGNGKLTGVGVSRGVVDGVARICEGTADLARVEQGDVLVAATTTSAINVVLPLLGGIVTDRGGALCHAALVSREFGIPAVVGTGDATRRIRDGQRVRVDGDAGLVEVLS